MQITKQVPAQLYTPSNGDKGEPVFVSVQGEHILISSIEQTDIARLPFIGLIPRYSGFNRDQVYLEWKSLEGDPLCLNFNAGNADQLVAKLHPKIKSRYQRVKVAEQTRRMYFKLSAIGGGLLLGLIALASLITIGYYLIFFVYVGKFLASH